MGRGQMSFSRWGGEGLLTGVAPERCGAGTEVAGQDGRTQAPCPAPQWCLETAGSTSTHTSALCPHSPPTRVSGMGQNGRQTQRG